MFRRCCSILLFVAVAGLPVASRADDDEIIKLPPFVTTTARVANDSPVGTFPMPVSGLRFEPAVDVQTRNFAEGQADISVRGGIFENTGFSLGGGALFDPQTGHYAAELPVAPAMLQPVRVLTGAEAALAGLNASVATLAYDWAPIRTRGEATAVFGEHSTVSGSLYQGYLAPASSSTATLGADIAISHSESDGAIPGGDHKFTRFAGRLQRQQGDTQTDLFAGYQTKFFGWPNLYTPYNWLETEDLATTLVAVNHRVGDVTGAYWQSSALWRRNTDDYEADRTRPGLFNPYQHETQLTSLALEGRHALAGDWALHGRAEVAADTIDSTSLTSGRFNSRTYLKLGAELERAFRLANGAELQFQGGAAWADDNRGGGDLSPIAELAWQHAVGGRTTRIYAQVAGDSQVASYTALNSAAGAGLFRGNPDLGRARSTNWELGFRQGGERFEVQAAFFFRQDRDLTDWTYRQGVMARTANAVDIDTLGFETVATYRWAHGRATLGYTWLQKNEDYGRALVDASFYALNFPRHRVTAALVWQPVQQVELRFDNEYREQEPDLLRRSSARAVISSLGVHWFVPRVRGLELSVQVENMWDCAFEEVPAVPASPRQYSTALAYRW
jgi:hypothetical protein